MSFVEKFKIPYTESVEWDKTVGRPTIERLGLCGKDIESRSSVYDHKFEVQKKSGFMTDDEGKYIADVVKNGFMNCICVMEKGHHGSCSATPYIPKGKNKIINGIVQKLKDPLTNPGDDPNKGANRSHKRNFPLAHDKETRSEWYKWNKETGFKNENQNAVLRLNMLATGCMMGLAFIDIYACILHSKGSEKYLDISSRFREILEQRWNELKELYAKKHIKIYDDNDYLQDPILWETIEIDWYGKGGEDLKGIQFGHVEPVSEEKWMTRSGNVLPITRETNLNQSSASLYNVMDRMRVSVRKQDHWESTLDK